MKQETFTDIEYSYRKKKTKREEFLEIMEEIIPWDEWVGVIEPYYPKGKRGRPPMGIEKMLRMYLLQIWFNLSDPATEDAIYDSYAMRKFTDIDFMTETVPDETTLCKFRHLLETNGLNKLFFDAINRVMLQTGHMMKGGTIVDATIINAPSSTKNAEKKLHWFDLCFSASVRLLIVLRHQKGQWVEIRDEMPHRCGCRQRPGSYHYGHGGK